MVDMLNIKTLRILSTLLMLAQLSACAVMSKKECLNANWQEIGYRVAVDGNPNMPTAFNKREKACAKHGAAADWVDFSQGHSDGTVEYCQLSNAVEVGVIGRKSTLDGNVCPESDYPGFAEAFHKGYELHLLNRDVQYTQSELSNLESRLYGYQKEIRRLREQIRSDELEQSEIESIKYRRREIKDRIYDVNRDIQNHENRLYHQLSRAEQYAIYLYDDFVLSLSDRYVDPRYND